VQRWSPGAHEDLTLHAASQVPFDPAMVRALVMFNQWVDIADIGYNAAVVATPTRWLRRQMMSAFSDTAPNHGEGGLYTFAAAYGAAKNRERQDLYLTRAVNMQRDQGRAPSFGVRDPTAEFRAMSVYRALGAALHVTQDRESHAEGAIGKGHDDQTNPDCDDPSRNSGAYRRALVNSIRLLQEFVAATSSRRDEQPRGEAREPGGR
jgi:hypothetical protein